MRIRSIGLKLIKKCLRHCDASYAKIPIMKSKTLLYFLVILLAAVLRFYQLGATPISLEWDEVAIGYDAYSILHTGRDQFGQIFPLTFRSLDDYKPPVYEYLAILPVAVFGLTELAVRFPSALFGTLAVLFTILLGKELAALMPGRRISALRIGLLAGFFLAVSPWHLQFSRAAFEVNISVAITIAAVWAFLVGLRRPALFYFSSVLFGIDLFSYHSTRVVTPLLLIALFALLHRRLPSVRRLCYFVGIYAIFFLFVLPILLSKQAQIRFAATNIFNPGVRYLNEKDLPRQFLQQRLQDARAGYESAGKIFHNQRFIYFDYETVKLSFHKYISHFGFEYLFIRGDAPLHHAPAFGLLYLWELPFMVVGAVYLLKHLNRYSLIILAWMLIAPIPVAVTREAPHAVRSELLLPTFQLITAVGVWRTIRLFADESKAFIWLFLLLSIPVFAANMGYYLHQYYVHTNYEISDKWLYGRKEAVAYTQSVKDQYDRVLVSLRLEMPHAFWLFYTQYPPQTYLAEGGTVSGGFADERNRFDKYEFRLFNNSVLSPDEDILLVGRAGGIPSDFPPGVEILRTIYYLDGTPGIIIARNRR